MDKLTCEVKEFARQVGADLVGIAGKECFERMPSVKPHEVMPHAQSVVVIIRRVNPYEAEYRPSWNSAEHFVGRLALLMHILLRTSAFLEDQGFETFPVSYHGYFEPMGEGARKAYECLTVTPEGELEGVEEFEKVFWERSKFLSHMKLAEEAGLGEIGRCKQLVTPQFGPRIGLVSLITDAPLEPDKRLEEPVCKKDECNKCVEYCRSGALQPYGYNIAKCLMQMRGSSFIEMLKKRDFDTIDRKLADARAQIFPGGYGSKEGVGCTICVLACPVGRKYISKPRWTRGKLPIYQEVF
jgi:ferredoxin